MADAQRVVNPLVQAPYRVEWGGEFQEMQEAEERLLTVVAVSLVLILLLLYLALRSFLDLFNNRLLSLLYRGWEKHRRAALYDMAAARGRGSCF